MSPLSSIKIIIAAALSYTVKAVQFTGGPPFNSGTRGGGGGGRGLIREGIIKNSIVKMPDF